MPNPNFPTRHEITNVAEVALALIGDRFGSNEEPVGHGPGGLYTAVAEFSLPVARRVIVAAAQDWVGNDPHPDLEVVIQEGYGSADGVSRARQTEYAFYSGGLFRPRYIVGVDVLDVDIDHDGRASKFIGLQGDLAVRSLARTTDLTRKERKLFRAAASTKYDTRTHKSLSEVLDECNPGNRIVRDYYEW